MPDGGTTNYRPRLFGPPDWREDRRLFRPPTLAEACLGILKRHYPATKIPWPSAYPSKAKRWWKP